MIGFFCKLAGLAHCGVVGLSVLAVSLASCQSRDMGNDPLGVETLPVSSRMSPVAWKKWQVMELSHQRSQLQPQCTATHFPAASAVPFQGFAILFHGFSACPQQYEELAPLLASRGFEVLIPLYPGHGVVPKSLEPRIDDVGFVPRTPALWESYVQDVNQLAQELDGKRVLIGLSHGVSVALRAMQRGPQLYDQAVLMAPKLRTEASFFTGLLTSPISILGIDEFILNRRSGWKRCAETDGKPPINRGGFCNMENRNAVAMLDFAKTVVGNAAGTADAQPTKTRSQFILSTEDDGIANTTAMEVISAMTASGQQAVVCKLPAGIPHSMFSKQDFPYEKPWVPDLFAKILGFVIDEKPFPNSTAQGGGCEILFESAVQAEG